MSIPCRAAYNTCSPLNKSQLCLIATTLTHWISKLTSISKSVFCHIGFNPVQLLHYISYGGLSAYASEGGARTKEAFILPITWN